MQVAILYDIDGWAYHAEAKGLQKYLRLNGVVADIYKVTSFNTMPKEQQNTYDVILLFPRQAKNITFDFNKIVTVFSSYGQFNFQEDNNGSQFKYIICRSQDILRKAKKAIPGKQEIFYMPLAIDTDLFYPAPDGHKKFTIGFAGNTMRAIKNFSLIQDVMEEMPEVEWKIASFDRRGRIPHEEMPKFYNSIDLLVCASTTEGGPLTSFEAGCCGVPTVTSCERSAIAEFIRLNEFHGELCPQTVDGFKKALWGVIKSPEWYENMRIVTQRDMWKMHSWTAVIPQYIEMFEKLLKEPK